jgi:preprotein translocase subunit SecY
MAVATVFAFFTSIYLATTFLPSITSTILQLRSGVIPTLRHKDFNKYRVAPDQVSILSGSLFWGTVYSSALMGVLVGALVFVCIWQVRVVFCSSVVNRNSHQTKPQYMSN